MKFLLRDSNYGNYNLHCAQNVNFTKSDLEISETKSETNPETKSETSY